jgi:pimeloyl-ACP methyl ester carboxylesterase
VDAETRPAVIRNNEENLRKHRGSDFSRREIGFGILAAGTSALLPVSMVGAGSMNQKPGTFVLVHGAFHGGWCYGHTAKALRDRGHTVFTPTLSGLAERSHEFSGNINLSTHIKDVVELIRVEQLNGIVLCGHSYAGMVITGVAAAVADRISTLVYLDAFLPDDNQSLFDIIGPEGRQMFLDSAGKLSGTGVAPLTAAYLGVNEKDRAWIDRLCTNQPIATFLEKLPSVAAVERIARKHYIMAENFGSYRWAYDKVKDREGWTRESVKCGHDVMVDEPEWLAKSLENLLS